MRLGDRSMAKPRTAPATATAYDVSRLPFTANSINSLSDDYLGLSIDQRIRQTYEGDSMGIPLKSLEREVRHGVTLSLSEKQHRERSRVSSWTRSKADSHSQQISSRGTQPRLQEGQNDWTELTRRR